MNNVHFSSEAEDWETPLSLFAELDQEFGPFDLDVAATDDNALVESYFTPESNGLARVWGGVCWCNPPYGREVSRWVEKAHEEALAGRATTVCLLPARTDTRWWHEHVMQADIIRFIKGRVHFRRGGKSGPAPFPSAVVVFQASPSSETPSSETQLEGRT